MAMSNITVAGITPTLSILGPTQQFIFDQNLSSFQLVNTFVPTAFIPSKTNSEFRNNELSGFRWIHTTQLGDTIGELKLQSFVNASPTGTDIFGINDSHDIVFYSPISFPGFIVTADINMDSYKIINLADPTDLQDAATKRYVDSIAAGFVFKESCYVASTANLTATYSNGAAGVGATLTNTGTLIAFAIDGVTPPINSRLLIKDQTSQFQNGAYLLTTVGDGLTPWVLTRTTDYDTSAEILTGTLFVIKNGTVNDGTIWLQTDIVTTVGTDPISFNQFTYGPSTFLQVNNNLDDLDNATTARLNLGLTDIAIQTVIDHSVLLGNAGDTITSLAVPAVANQILLSGGVATDPSWSTAIYPANTTANQLLYSSADDTITELTTANNGILITNGSGVPSIGSVLPSAVQANITSTGTIASGVWNATTIAVDAGGTGFETTIPYGVVCGGVTSTGDLQNAGIGSAGQVLSSTGTSSLPIWVSPAGGAPFNATYIVQTADVGLPNAQVLAVLTTGLLKNTTATGVLSAAVAGVDYYAPGYPTRIIDSGGAPYNFFIGTSVGNLVTTGDSNTAAGVQALQNIAAGTHNTAFGAFALADITDGSRNVAVGNSTLRVSTTGSNNSAFGSLALISTTTGSNNTSIGREASYNNTVGNSNVSVGHLAGYAGTDNNDCVFIGASSGASGGNRTNSIALGANATVVTDNTCVIGTSGMTLNVGGDGVGNIIGTWTGAVIPVNYGGTGLSTTTANQLLYSSATNTIGGLSTANDGVLTTNGSGVPSIGSTLPSVVQGNITSTGTISTGAWNGTAVTVPFGGTGLTSTTAYGVICGGTTTTGNLQNIGAGIANKSLVSNGVGNLPTWKERSWAMCKATNNLLTTSLTVNYVKLNMTAIFDGNIDFDSNGGIANRMRYIGTHESRMLVTYSISYSLSNTTTFVSFIIYRNGTEQIDSSRADKRAAEASTYSNNQVSMSTLINMFQYDYVEIFAKISVTNRTITPDFVTFTATQCD